MREQNVGPMECYVLSDDERTLVPVKSRPHRTAMAMVWRTEKRWATRLIDQSIGSISYHLTADNARDRALGSLIAERHRR